MQSLRKIKKEKVIPDPKINRSNKHKFIFDKFVIF